MRIIRLFKTQYTPHLCMHLSRIHLLIVCFIGCTLPIPAIAQVASYCDSIAGNLVQNCGFEAYTANWTFQYSGNVHENTSNSGNSHSGNWESYVNAYPGFGSLSQSISTTVGNIYKIDFWMENNGGRGLITITFGGNILYSYEGFQGGDYPNYSQYSFTTIASSTESTLNIDGQRVNATFFFDDFVVTDQGAAPAPAPGLLPILLFLGKRIRRAIITMSERTAELAKQIWTSIRLRTAFRVKVHGMDLLRYHRRRSSLGT